MRHLIAITALLAAVLMPFSLAARIYIWTDDQGVKHYSQEPPPEHATAVEVKDEMRYDASADAKSHRSAASGTGTTANARQTRILIEDNILFVPVTLAYGGREVEALLVLDTGSSSTVLAPALAASLGIQPEINAKVKVAGGEKLDAQAVVLDFLRVGPHTRRDVRTLVLRHRNAQAKLNGALGLSFLKHYPYSIDMQKQVINWGVDKSGGDP
ncbi:MAG: aspartyl protease family protein [Desulfobacterales bacterium]|nr:aspartyl protease family protein [Desulfobacterales bacterium]MDJ0883632.1 aspartyl protease family protein [Desulfobacterales bacterium]